MGELIYIPLWLDLLYTLTMFTNSAKCNLHSTMVRFIIRTGLNRRIGKVIYIPLWLDLLCNEVYQVNNPWSNLHSTMVRFII